MDSLENEYALIPTILCGGSGSRLWPVSREAHPKPFIRLSDGESFLQKAFLRGVELPNVKEIMTVTNRELFFKTEDEYEEVDSLVGDHISTSFILEPFGRNTAPAIAAASIQAAETHGDDAILLVLTADHLIEDKESFANAVAKACELAKTGKIVTFGIQPTSPETGYGYIESSGHDVIRFVEKPSLEKAEEYLKSGNFLWNSGMFCFTAKSMLQEMEKHCPDVINATRNCIEHARKVSGTKSCQVEITPEYFKMVPDDSIDYAVMEKTSNAAVVACDIGWSDIGCWQALGDLAKADENNNRIKGDVLIQDSRNCTIESENRMVGVVGVDNLVIVDTPDALLVVDKKEAQKVKQIYSQLKALGHDAHKHHRTAYRPWGTYTVLEEGPHFKIKRIEVKQGASLSLQMHHHRSEHWIVVSGTAKVINGEKELTLKLNESTFIPAEHKHRLENIGSEWLVMIEVQTGSYLGEDDIVRFQDVYGRVS
ncbi:MAG: mannose-1-phosphate guanylyltransferase/mannose-6-phosphate isomerase [Cycloclasticus sp.]